MKKVLSISLIVIMVLSLGLSALGMSAAEESAPETVVPGITSEATGADATKAGNLTTPGSKTFDSTWTAITSEAGLNSMTANGKYYLADNITVTSTRSNTAAQTIDGNGYTITASVPIFNEVKGLTLQNVTIVSTLTHNDNGYTTALAKWNSHDGALKLNNVTCTTTIDSIKCTSDYQYLAGLAMRATAGSEFNNVVVTANITADNANVEKLQAFAGMIGFAEGNVKFENCIVNGTFTVNKKAVKGCSNNDRGIGGFAGAATGGCTFLNCTSNVNISVEAPADTDGTACKSLGGFVGFSNSGTTFKNCINNGNITTSATATGWQVGGIVGHIWSGMSLDTCKNTGDITCADVTYAGGLLGHSNTANTTIKNCENTGNISNKNQAGGIVAFATEQSSVTTEKLTIEACANSGSVTSNEGGASSGGIAGRVNVPVEIKDSINTGAVAGTFTVGGIGGYFTNADAVVSNCVNGVAGDKTKAAITIESGDWAGGIVAAGDKTQFKNCINYANISGEGSNRIGGIVGQLHGAPGGFWDCVNYGDVTDEGGKPVGGLTGEYTNGITVSGVNKNYGTITSTGGHAGGMFGQTSVNATITNAENHGAVSGKNVGGILGYSNVADVTLTIEDCINEGKITTTFTGGGMVGYIAKTNSVIRNCVNLSGGEIAAANAGTYLGGIGGALDTLIELSDCKNYGYINSADYKSARVAGISAQIYGGKGTVTNNENHGAVTTAGANSDMGGIAGTVSAAVFTGNKNTGTITTTAFMNHLGGIVGNITVSRVEIAQEPAEEGEEVTPEYVEGSGVMANNENSGVINSVTVKYVGGIAGYANAYEFNNNTNKGAITLTGNVFYLGGVAGEVVAANKMNGNVNEGAVSATGAFSGQAIRMGGLAGSIAVGSNDSEFKNNENRGSFTVTETSDGDNWLEVGGIAGYCNTVALYEDCRNSGAITVVTRGHNGIFVSGLVGITYKTATYENCSNSGDISVKGISKTYYGVGGGIGWTNTAMSAKNYTNSGDITVDGYSISNTNAESKMYLGGFTGYINSALTLENCVNTGDIKAIGGQEIGGYGAGGLSGAAGKGSSAKNCINEGSITAEAQAYAGGIVGNVSGGSEFVNCLNLGDISSRWAGGIVGLASGSSEYKFSGAVNAGDLVGSFGAGGIVARASGNTVAVEGCANEGGVKGIYAAGIVACIEASANTTVKNCYSIGEFEVINPITTNPIANGAYAYEGNMYCSTAMKGYDEGDLDTLKNIESAMASYETFWFYGMTRLTDAIKAAEKITDGSGYSAFTWNKFAEALEFAKGVAVKDRFTITEGEDGEYIVTFLTQADVNRAYNALVDAKDGLTLKGAVGNRVSSLMAAADLLIGQESAFLPDSWVEFADIYPAVKEYVASISDFDAVEPTEVLAVMDTLEAAMSSLVAGGEINDADDFAAIDGKDGTYVLNHDITISKPLDNFAGTLIGNGYTITLDGCGLSKVFNGGAIHFVKIAGDAGEAQSVLGKAIGQVEISALTVEVESLGSAALISSADKNAKINVTYVVSYADAAVGAIVGNVNCVVKLDGVVANGTAPALTGTVAKGSSIKGSYLAGVEFYGADAKKVDSADILASGKVAYEMNVYLTKLAPEVERKMAVPTLVQVIGTDAAPVIGTPAIDDSNVVVPEYDSDNSIVGYKNPSKTPSLDVEESPEMPDSVPEAPVYDSLNSAIGRAEELVADTYTEESWAALQTALASAKAALEATEQQSIDNATNALNMAMAGLKVKPEEAAKVDYSKLQDTIKEAEELDEADYTDGSWAALSSALAKAKLALDYTEQSAVDSANTALLRAISGLVKVSADDGQQQKPADPDDSKESEPSDDEAKGCGSVIGGAAVMLVSVIALAGMTFKKKED